MVAKLQSPQLPIVVLVAMLVLSLMRPKAAPLVPAPLHHALLVMETVTASHPMAARLRLFR